MLTEASAGSDANSGKTKAVLSEDGKYYTLTGTKIWITNGGFADIFITFARIEDDKFITGFVLEKGMKGLNLGAEEKKLGIRNSSTRTVFLEDVQVPVGNLLGERGRGFHIAMNGLNVGRIKLGLSALDSCRIVITNSV